MGPDRELSGTPSMTARFARAGASLIPGASRLPFVAGRGREIPDYALTLRDITVDRDRLAAYDRVCGFTLRDTLPASYPHMLAFPLHLALMTDGSFPLPAIGLVHIANRIVQHRPIRTAEPLSLRVWGTPLEPHPRGRQFSVRSEARVGDELVWEESSTNLHRGSGGDAGSGGSAVGSVGAGDFGPPSAGDFGPPSAGELPATATWRLRGDLGRRYGSVSGDLNPIHVHPLTARLFGFPTAIAHGMWTKARCLAALDARLPAAFTVEVAFKRPILLPATVEFAQAPAAGEGRGGDVRFAVRDATKQTLHLDGLVSVGD